MALPFGSYASLSGLLSARPSPDPLQIGRYYFATDVGITYRDNGTAWQNMLGYEVYEALLTQDGLGAPVAIVLRNSLGGEIVWTREDQGRYNGTLAGAFPQSKVTIHSALNTLDGANNQIGMYILRLSENVIQVYTFLQTDYSGIDSQLYYSTIEIRVYS